MSKPDTKTLRKACEAVAENTMWEPPNPRGMDGIITTQGIEKMTVAGREVAKRGCYRN